MYASFTQCKTGVNVEYLSGDLRSLSSRDRWRSGVGDLRRSLRSGVGDLRRSLRSGVGTCGALCVPASGTVCVRDAPENDDAPGPSTGVDPATCDAPGRSTADDAPAPESDDGRSASERRTGRDPRPGILRKPKKIGDPEMKKCRD